MIERLKKNYKYSPILGELTRAEEFNQKHECLLFNENTAMIVINYDGRDVIELIFSDINSVSETEIKKMFIFLNEKYSNYDSLHFDILDCNEKQMSMIDSCMENICRKENIILGYVKNNSTDQSILKTDKIRLLSKEDNRIFSEFPQEKITNRPSPNILFDAFINEEEGQILGYFDNNILKGYLSFISMFENIDDVDYIYVLPEYRNQKIGKNLADFYSEFVLSNKHIAFWSSAQNNESVYTALSAGFENCYKRIFCKKCSKFTPD
jgi:GNAT superfamily N-acetyltransferase